MKQTLEITEDLSVTLTNSTFTIKKYCNGSFQEIEIEISTKELGKLHEWLDRNLK